MNSPIRVRFKLRIFAVVLFFLCCYCSGQKVNLLFINEDGNVEANRAVQIAIKYIAENPENPLFGFVVDMKQVNGNRTAPKEFLAKLCEVYSESIAIGEPPHIVLDTTMTPTISEISKSFTSVLALPTISGSFGQENDIQQWRNIDQEKRRYLLQIMPPSDIIPGVIRSIVVHMNMTNAGILFDNTFVMDHKYKVLLKNVGVKYIMTEFVSPEQIVRMRKLDITNFFILGRLSSIKRILEAIRPEYFEKNFAWHIITQDFGNISICCGNFNMILLRPKSFILSKTKHLQLAMPNVKHFDLATIFYFDLTLRTLLIVQKMLSTNKWPKMEYLTCDNYNGSNTPKRSLDLKSYFIGYPEPTSYGSFSFPDNKKPFNGHSTITFDMDVLKVKMQKEKKYSETIVGKWTTGFTTSLTITKNINLDEFKTKKIYRVYTVVQPPFVMRDPKAKRGYIGYCIDLMDRLAKMSKFDYVISEVAEHGQMDENGTWNGIVRKLIDREADIGLATMQVMGERERVIDFSIPYYDMVGISILILIPRSKNSLFKFLTVLEYDVWLCVVGAYFFTSILMYIFDRWSPYSYQNNKEKYADDDEKREFTLKESMWFCLTSLTPQGGGEAPKNLSGRLVAATWWLFGFIVIASYTANLAAFLTVSRFEHPVENLDDLTKQFKILYAPINGSQAMHFFQRMSEIEGRFYEIWKDMSLNDSLSPLERSKLSVWDYPVSDKFTKIWQAMQEYGLPNSLEEAVARIRNSTSARGFALIGDATDVYYLHSLGCEFQILGDQFASKPYAIAFQKGSTLKDEIDSALVKVLNDRFTEDLKEKWVKKKIICPKLEDHQDGIPVSNIGGIFIVIFFGILFAFLILIFEYFWFKYYKCSSNIINVI